MPPVRYHYDRFPPMDLNWQRLVPLLGPARGALERYDELLAIVPNPRVLLSPLTTEEAVLSSKIEGTVTTITEVLEFEAEGKPASVDGEKKADIMEVLNYRAAILRATEMLNDLPLSGRIIKAAHAILLDGTRGKNKAPGEYRRTANWIGPEGCPEEQARFVPIDAGRLPDGLSAWERYLHGDQPDPLIQLAILHAEFEALHPFLDGNGRLGRMLIPLFLFSRKLLRQPTFYISAYLEARREEYYDRLLAVSSANDWTGWCVFFMEAMVAQAGANVARARQILDLYREMKQRIADLTHSQHSFRAVDFIFERPIFRASDFVKHSGIPEPTAKRVLRLLREDGLFNELRPSSGQRPATLAFAKLLNIAEGRDAF